MFSKKQIIEGFVTNKRSQTVHSRGFGIIYYVTIGTKELLVSAQNYKILSKGDYVTALYKRGGMFDNEILVRIL